MGERIAKASKVPFVIRFFSLGKVAVCGLSGYFVWLTEGHENEEHGPIIIDSNRPQYNRSLPPYPGSYSVNGGSRNGNISRSIAVHKAIRHA